MVIKFGFSITKMASFYAQTGIPSFSRAPENVNCAGHFAMPGK